jgi:hypothetical protein
VLEALSLIAEEYHNISPGSVSALWESWYKIEYVHGSDITAFIKRIRSEATQMNIDGQSLERKRPGPDNTMQLQRMVDGMRSAGGSEFDQEIAFAMDKLDSAAVSNADVVAFAQKCKITGSYKFPGTSVTPGNKSFVALVNPGLPVVASVYPLDNRARAIATMICNICGGKGHFGRNCATIKHRTPPADDGTSRPIPDVDRDITFKDNTGANDRGAGTRGTGHLKKRNALERRLSAKEWAALPWIEGTTKPCSVTVGGKKCNGKHRHAKCPMLPAAKAEKAAKAAVSGRPSPTNIRLSAGYHQGQCSPKPFSVPIFYNYSPTITSERPLTASEL